MIKNSSKNFGIKNSSKKYENDKKKIALLYPVRAFSVLNNFRLIKLCLKFSQKRSRSPSSKIMLLKFNARHAKQLVYPRRNWA